MVINDPIWVEGEVGLINAVGTSLEGLWVEGESRLYGEYEEEEPTDTGRFFLMF